MRLHFAEQKQLNMKRLNYHAGSLFDIHLLIISEKEMMFLVFLFICLSVSTITQTVMNGLQCNM